METFIIGITGGSGSGKTTFVNLLKDELIDTPVTFISMDNYYKPRDEQYEDDEGIKNFDLPSSLDHEAFLTDLNKLRNGEKVIQKEYTFNNANAKPLLIEINPAPVLGLQTVHGGPRRVADATPVGEELDQLGAACGRYVFG